MTVLFIGLLTVIMVLDCLFLILLVLMQLPKKEAGAGLAFGGAATDALFGAGSGNFLTKATKYSAILFFGLAVVLGVMQSRYNHRSNLGKNLNQLQTQQPQQPITTPAAQPSAPISAPITAAATNNLLLSAPPTTATPVEVESNTPAPQK
jgi:preprotein translocase subunit SecG